MTELVNVRATEFAGCLLINIHDLDDEATAQLHHLVADVRHRDVVIHFLHPKVLEHRAVAALTHARNAAHAWGRTLRVVCPTGRLPKGMWRGMVVYQNPAEALEAALSARDTALTVADATLPPRDAALPWQRRQRS